MKLTEISVKNSTSIFVLVFMFMIAGIISYVEMPREAFPDIPIPFVIVSTPYIGVSPTDIENLVTNPLEKEFKGLDDLKEMKSTSAESVSLITMEFDPNANVDTVLQNVRDKVSVVKPDLPSDAEEPQILEINSSDFPILIINIAGNIDPVKLKQIAEDLQEELETDVKGILRVDLNGGVNREIRVEPDPDKLQQYDISLNQIVGTVQQENVTLPGGNVDIGDISYTVRVPGEFENVSEIENLIVAVKDGNPIYLRDLGTVRDTFEDLSSKSSIITKHQENGVDKYKAETNISLSVVKRSGSNILDVVDQTKVILKKYEEQNQGVSIVTLNDASKAVMTQVTDLQNNIITGLLLVFLILFFFMGGARNALLVAICIPVSIFITFIIITFLGFTLNTMILFSLVLAVGLLIDNAIVVVENIYRHAGQGKSNLEAAIEGTSQVAWPIIGGTATTLAAFFPLTLWPGIMGKFMSFLPKTVIVALLASLFVALVVNPTFSSKFLRAKPNETQDENEVPDNILYRSYRKTINTALNFRITVILFSIITFIGSGVLLATFGAGVEFFPKTTPDKFEISVEMPEGTTLEETESVLSLLAAPLKDHPELVQSWIIDTGVKGGSNGSSSGRAKHYGRISVQLVDVADQPSDPEIWLDELREQYKNIPGANILINVERAGPPTGKAVNIDIKGTDLQEMSLFSNLVKDHIRGIPGLIDLTDDLELTKPEIHVNVDRERARLAGISMQELAQFIRIAVNGLDATKYREGDDEFDVVVVLPEEFRKSLTDIQSLRIANRNGVMIPLSEIATVTFGRGTGSIHHVDQSRVVTVSAGAATGYFEGEILAEVQKRVAELKVPPGMSISYTGQNQDQEEATVFMEKAMGAALLLIFFVLVTQFNSLLQPLIIMATVLLSFIGVFLSIVITGMPFNVIMHGIAIISLAGIVVNNGIVLIDYINVLRQQGYDKEYAVRTAGLVRMRPVLLTTATTLLSMIPMAVGISIDFVNFGVTIGGTSVEFWQPMAIGLSSGLLVATGLTLIVVPVMYSIFDDIEQFFARRLSKYTGVPIAMPYEDPLEVEQPNDSSNDSSDDSTDGSIESPSDKTARFSSVTSLEQNTPSITHSDEESDDPHDNTDDLSRDDESDDGDEKPKKKKGGVSKSLIYLLIGGSIAFSSIITTPDIAWAQTPQNQNEEVTPSESPNNNSDSAKNEVAYSVPADVETPNLELRSPESMEEVEAFTLPASRNLTYQEAMEIAYRNNLNVAKAQNNIAVASTLIKQAYAMVLPSFNAGGSFTLNQEERSFRPFPEELNLSQYGISNKPVIIQPKWTYNWYVSATLSANFRAISLLKQAYLREDIAKKGVDVAKEQIGIGVVQQFFALLTIQEAMAISKEQFESAQTMLNVTDKRKSLGAATEFEVTRAKLRLAQAKASGAKTKSQFLKLRASLANLLQTEPNFKVVSPGKTELTQTLGELKSRALDRESIKLAKLQTDLADEEVGEMIYRYLPTFSLTFRYAGTRDVGLGGGGAQWNLILSADWLIWDGGSREAEWDRLKAQRVGIEIDQKIAQQEIDGELDVAYAEYKAALAEIESTKTQVELAKKGLEQAQKGYSYGVTSQLDIVNAEDDLRSAQLGLIQNKLSLDLAIRKLKVLAGIK